MQYTPTITRLKNSGRVERLLGLYSMVELVQALLERERRGSSFF
jgi:hypothetical protein